VRAGVTRARDEEPAVGWHFNLLNHQRRRPIDRRLLGEITRYLLTERFPHEQMELAIHLVAAPEMTRLNERFLQHAGSTDVITFDYAEAMQDARRTRRNPRRSGPAPLCGEIFICIDDAITQARQFRTTWQSELARYVIHGLLHLHGYDDLNSVARRRMKREENRVLRVIQRQFALQRLDPAERPSSAANKNRRRPSDI
jgi:probable rRNA maturation factor